MTDRAHETTWLTVDSKADIQHILREIDVLSSDESIESVSPAGEGNMNLTLRVTTSAVRSLIVKQSRPWVEKYPSIAAPVERVDAERRFYELTNAIDSLVSRMPTLLAHSQHDHLLVLSDLGPSADMTSLYSSPEIEHERPAALGGWLADLHAIDVADSLRDHYRNRALRELNHAHIFEIPFGAELPFTLDDVTPGLEGVARSVRSNTQLREAAAALGERYLADGPTLLHGDFFPGSWLDVDGEIYVIDPEFSHCGAAEFDLGVAVGHLLISGIEHQAIDAFTNAYVEKRSGADRDLVKQFAAVEILRRLLGVAQLPLPMDLDAKTALIDEAVATLLR